MSHPEVGSVWKHRKGNLYLVRGIAQGCDSARGEAGIEGRVLVMYEAWADRQLWCRELSEFLDGRFTLVPDTARLAGPDGSKSESKALQKGPAGAVPERAAAKAPPKAGTPVSRPQGSGSSGSGS